MIEVGVRDNDMSDALCAAAGRKDRGEVRLALGARIYHGKVGVTHDVGVGALIGHGRGVGRHDAAQPRFEPFGHTDRGVKIVDIHGVLGLSSCPAPR